MILIPSQHKYLVISYIWSSTHSLSESRGPEDRRRRRQFTSVMWDFVHLRRVFVTRIIRFIFAQCVDSVVETLGACCLQYEKQESQTAFDLKKKKKNFYPTPHPQPKKAFEYGVEKRTCSKHDKNLQSFTLKAQWSICLKPCEYRVTTNKPLKKKNKYNYNDV